MPGVLLIGRLNDTRGVLQSLAIHVLRCGLWFGWLSEVMVFARGLGSCQRQCFAADLCGFVAKRMVRAISRRTSSLCFKNSIEHASLGDLMSGYVQCRHG